MRTTIRYILSVFLICTAATAPPRITCISTEPGCWNRPTGAFSLSPPSSLHELQASIHIEQFKALGEKHLRRALEPHPGMPRGLVDIENYIKASQFKKSGRYEIPHEIFTQKDWSQIIQDPNEQDTLSIFLYRCADKPIYSYGDKENVRLSYYLNSQEMEALFLDIYRQLKGQRFFDRHMRAIEKQNCIIDEGAKDLLEKLKRPFRDEGWKAQLRASCASELLSIPKTTSLRDFQDISDAGTFMERFKNPDFLGIDDSRIFIDRITSLCRTKNASYLHIADKHGPIIFDLDIFGIGLFKKWLLNNHPGKHASIDWDDPDPAMLESLLSDPAIRDECVKITFAAKKERSLPADVTIEDLHRILEDEKFLILRILHKNKIFSIIDSGSLTPGTNLNDASDDLIDALQNASLIGVKGSDNTLTVQFLKKDHFVLGSAVDYGIQCYTGLLADKDLGELPSGYVAFIPADIPAVHKAHFLIPVKQNLWQFVQARAQYDETHVPCPIQKIKERIRTYNDCYIDIVMPELHGDTPEAKKVFSYIRTLALEKNIPFQEALVFFVEQFADPDIRDSMLEYTVEELNLAYKKRMVKEILQRNGSYTRTAYRLKTPLPEYGGLCNSDPGTHIGTEIKTRSAYERISSGKRIVVNGIIILQSLLQRRYARFGTTNSKKTGHNLINPFEATKDTFAGEEQGLLFNFLFFLTNVSRRMFNMSSRQMHFDRDTPYAINMHVGFQKDEYTGEIFAPLYHKGAIAFFEDGRCEFARVRLGKGSLKINNCIIRWVPFNEVVTGINPDAIAYTPMYDQNLEANGITHFGDHYVPGDRTSARHGRKNRMIYTPPDTDRVNVIIVRNRIVQIREDQAEIPPMGWVLSVRRDVFNRMKAGLSGELTMHKDHNSKLYYTMLKRDTVTFSYDGLPAGWDQALSINGGGYLIYRKEEGRLPISRILDIEGWNLNTSRRTQGSHMCMVDRRTLRQIIGKTTDDDFIIYTFTGGAQYTQGVTLDEALDIIELELKKKNKTLAYALNLDGGSATCTGVVKNRKLYTLHVIGQDCKHGMGKRRPVNCFGFIKIRSIPDYSFSQPVKSPSLTAQ